MALGRKDQPQGGPQWPVPPAPGHPGARSRSGRRPRRPLSTLDFPVDDPKIVTEHLSRPFAVADLRWKVQAVYARGQKVCGTIVPFIDRGLVIARLNRVVGLDWNNPEPEREGRAGFALRSDDVTPEPAETADDQSRLRRRSVWT